MAAEDGKKQLLHLVFGGELKKLGEPEFRDLDGLDIVGIYPDYQSAHTAWKAKAQPAWTMPTCVISSFICTACWIRTAKAKTRASGRPSGSVRSRARSIRRGQRATGSLARQA